MCRQLPRRDYMGLKAAFRELVEKVGGVQRAGTLTRVDKSRISLYQSVDHEQYPPIDVVADLEAECGDYPVTRFLASLAHMDLIGRPRGRPVDSLVKGIRAVSREAADAVSAMAQAAGDGDFSVEEAEEVLAEIEDLFRAASPVAAHARKVLEARK